MSRREKKKDEIGTTSQRKRILPRRLSTTIYDCNRSDNNSFHKYLISSNRLTPMLYDPFSFTRQFLHSRMDDCVWSLVIDTNKRRKYFKKMIPAQMCGEPLATLKDIHRSVKMISF